MYCTYYDLVDMMTQRKIIELATDTEQVFYNSSGFLDSLEDWSGIVDNIIKKASDEIDSYVTVPSPVPGVIKKICADLSLFYLKNRRSPADPINPELYDRSVKSLSELRDSKLILSSDNSSISYSSDVREF